jgi:NADH-quinone oxidoreductase subunit D
MTVEKLIGVEVPKRVDYMRVILMELARIGDHLICNGVIGMDQEQLQVLLICSSKENVSTICMSRSGARMTTNMGRIGGFERDFTPKFHELLKIS